MHGYFVSLKLYDTARVIVNPFAYAEHREKLVKERMEKLADTRIRTRKNTASASVKINKALADKIQKDVERAKRKEERKGVKKATQIPEVEEGTMEIDETLPSEEPLTLLNDPRFQELFEDPEFAVDENTREYALLNPSAVAQRKKSGTSKTTVEEESDRSSSDGLDEDSEEHSEDESGSDNSSDGGQSTMCRHWLIVLNLVHSTHQV